eukprot:scaffold7362_cov266-Pinguiococcus_pyrenoidosus.AAC.4
MRRRRQDLYLCGNGGRTDGSGGIRPSRRSVDWHKRAPFRAFSALLEMLTKGPRDHERNWKRGEA